MNFLYFPILFDFGNLEGVEPHLAMGGRHFGNSEGANRTYAKGGDRMESDTLVTRGRGTPPGQGLEHNK